MNLPHHRYKLKMTEPTEAAILKAILIRLAYHPKVAWVHRMNSGAGKVQRREGGTSQFMRWGFAGCPDIVAGLKDGRTAWIEVKRPSGRVREEQEAFINSCIAYGIPAGIARSQEDAVAIVDCKFRVSKAV